MSDYAVASTMTMKERTFRIICRSHIYVQSLPAYKLLNINQL